MAVPQRVSNVLVDMVALGQRICEWFVDNTDAASEDMPGDAPVRADRKVSAHDMVIDEFVGAPRVRTTKLKVPVERILVWMIDRGNEAVARGGLLKRVPTINAACAKTGLNCDRASARKAWGRVPHEMRYGRGKPPKSAADNRH